MKNQVLVIFAAFGAALAGVAPFGAASAQTGIATSSPATLANGSPAYPSYDLTNNLRITGSITTTPSGSPQPVTVSPSSAATDGIAPVKSTAAESSHVLKASPGNLYSLTTSVGATSGWVLVFDATSAPADGAVTPAWWFPIISDGTRGAISASWLSGPPLNFATGITAVFSTTGPFTKTASSTAAFTAEVK